MPSSISNSATEGEIQHIPSSIHRDLFSTTAAESNIHYDNTTCSKKTASSIHSKEINDMTSWKMKALVLLCMLSLPGKME
jgi:hypothetical protein